MGRTNKCANTACSAVCRREEGKLFRLDINLGNTAGMRQCKTVYVWLCAGCAREMNPNIKVVGDTVSIVLESTKRIPVSGLPAKAGNPPRVWVN